MLHETCILASTPIVCKVHDLDLMSEMTIQCHKRFE